MRQTETRATSILPHPVNWFQSNLFGALVPSYLIQCSSSSLPHPVYLIQYSSPEDFNFSLISCTFFSLIIYNNYSNNIHHYVFNVLILSYDIHYYYHSDFLCFRLYTIIVLKNKYQRTVLYSLKKETFLPYVSY